MRFAIRQTAPNQKLWLVRATKKGVWGSSERAFNFFRRRTAEHWINRLVAAAPNLALEIVELTGGRLPASQLETDGTPAPNDVELSPALAG